MHGIQPVQTLTLPDTNKTQAELEEWLRVNDSRYTMTTYNLLTNNCNNFADDLLKNGLGLANGVPPHILDIPRQFIQSPMGAMIAPMITNMYQVRTSKRAKRVCKIS